MWTLTCPSGVLGNQDEISLNGVWLELHAFVSLGRGGFKDGCIMV